MESQVCARITALRPGIDAAMVGLQGLCHGLFGNRTVGPSGCSRDVAFVHEASAQLVIGSSDVFL